MAARHRVVMVSSSYPRFPGDTIATFLEPIALGVAARGHDVHVVAPWHPEWRRESPEAGITFHLFRYAPHPALNVFGYAGALKADVSLRAAAWAAAPLALAAGWRAARAVASAIDATVLHGHWVVPGGAIAAAAAGHRPLVISLHGSDVYVAERHAVAGWGARHALRRAGFVTACSEDLRERAFALGAAPERSETIPYGVDVTRFRPDPTRRAATRAAWGLDDSHAVVLAAGRFVRKKGFEFLIDAVANLVPRLPAVRLVLAGGGDLEPGYRGQIAARGLTAHAILPGVLAHDDVAAALAAADVVVVPSVRDTAGNVDGLPNVVLEALASATPVVACPAGGIGAIVRHGETGLLVPERDVPALAAALGRLLGDPVARARLGTAARAWAAAEATWARVAERFEAAYEAAGAWRQDARHA